MMSRCQGSVRQGSSESVWGSGITLPVSANVHTEFHFGEGFYQLSLRLAVQASLSEFLHDMLLNGHLLNFSEALRRPSIYRSSRTLQRVFPNSSSLQEVAAGPLESK